MKFLPTELPDAVLVEPTVHRDARGFFLEAYHEERYRQNGIPARFVQDNHSASVAGTLRGMHAQLAPHAQAKLIRVLRGRILDVIVDARLGSPGFGRHVAVELDDASHRQLYVPEGFLHGFYVLSENAEVEYKCSAPYAPECEIAVAWNDPELALPWPDAAPRLSPRDAAAPAFAAVRDRLPRYAAP